MGTSPNVLNYQIGKGTVSIKLEGEGSFRDIGNVPEFELIPEIEHLEHFSSQSGTKTKDRTVVIQKGATVRIVMEEITAKNLQLAILGAISVDTAGDDEIDILSLSELVGAVQFVGANDIGQQVDISLLRVQFTSGSPFNPISDEWGRIEITGDVVAVAGVFGTMTVRDVTSV